MSESFIYQDTEERALFHLIAGGDEKAFKQLFHRYVPEFQTLIGNIIKTDTAIKDVVQEVFLRVWLNREKLPDIIEPRAWLFRIAYFQCYTWLRKKGVREKAQDTLYKAATEAPLTSEVEETAVLEETARLIQQAIQLLPPQTLRIYRLSREEGFKSAEIAAQLDISVQTVKNTLTRALKNIKDYLEQHGVSIPFILLWYWLK